MDMFGPKWTRGRQTAKDELHIEFMDLGLRDDEKQQVDCEALVNAVRFVHRHRANSDGGDDGRGAASGDGGSTKCCLVHCAMGKSRSTMVVLAYLLSLPVGTLGHQEDVDKALAFVKTKRKMAQPNIGFMEQLKEMQRRGVFAEALGCT
jgi:protein-tyrosine phosphatase